MPGQKINLGKVTVELLFLFFSCTESVIISLYGLFIGGYRYGSTDFLGRGFVAAAHGAPAAALVLEWK